MRQLMPAGFTALLLDSTGCRQRATISDVVLLEQTTSKYWPAVVALAKKTNPTGYAAWEAAQEPTTAQAA